MANEDVTTEDLKATAQAKADQAKEAAQATAEEVKDRLSNLTINQKLVITAVVAVAASVVIQRFAKRPIRINADRLVVVEPPLDGISR